MEVITRDNHGIGALSFGAKVSVILCDKYEKESFLFELSVAAIICRKDNTEMWLLTIHNELTTDFKMMAMIDLIIILNEAKKVDYTFDGNCAGVSKSLCVSVYVVEDLAFYGMILAKEGMSGKWCHLCKLSHKGFPDLAQIGECWEYDKMIKLAN